MRRRDAESDKVVRVASCVVRVTPLPALTPLRRSTTSTRALNSKLAFSASVMLATVLGLVSGTAIADSSSGAIVGAAVAPTAVGDGVGKSAGTLSVGEGVVGATVVGGYDTGLRLPVGCTVTGENVTVTVAVGAVVTGAYDTGASDAVGATVTGAYDEVGSVAVGATCGRCWSVCATNEYGNRFEYNLR